jgi:hypothetical protein
LSIIASYTPSSLRTRQSLSEYFNNEKTPRNGSVFRSSGWLRNTPLGEVKSEHNKPGSQQN